MTIRCTSDVPSPIDYRQACSVVRRYRSHVKTSYVDSKIDEIVSGLKLPPSARPVLGSILADLVGSEPDSEPSYICTKKHEASETPIPVPPPHPVWVSSFPTE